MTRRDCESRSDVAWSIVAAGVVTRRGVSTTARSDVSRRGVVTGRVAVVASVIASVVAAILGPIFARDRTLLSVSRLDLPLLRSRLRLRLRLRWRRLRRTRFRSRLRLRLRLRLLTLASRLGSLLSSGR